MEKQMKLLGVLLLSALGLRILVMFAFPASEALQSAALGALITLWNVAIIVLAVCEAILLIRWLKDRAGR